MEYQDILDLFMKEEAVEVQQKIYGKNINDIPYEVKDNSIPRIPKETFFNKGNVYIRKHNRYADMFPHTHEFVEFNFMAKGCSIQNVNGQEVVLREGDILLMDREVVQSVKALQKDDLLINILIREDTISTDLVLDLAKSSSIVNKFFINASSEYSNHNKYIYFDTRDNSTIRSIIENIITEYYKEGSYFMKYINIMVSALIIELSRTIEKNQSLFSDLNDEETLFIDILHYIEQNFSTINLKILSDKFGFNPDYISYKLKLLTGQSFKQLVNEKRLEFIEYKLKETEDTIENIAYQAGYQNTSALYKFLKKYTNRSPIEIRRQFKVN